MTLPPDLASSAVRKLRESSAAAALVADATLLVKSGIYPNGMIAQREDNSLSTPVLVEGSGKAGILISARSPWTTPNRHNTARFPRLQVEIFADCSRNAMGQVTVKDAVRRCEYIFNMIDPVFHDPGNTSHIWPLDFYVVSCIRGQDLSIMNIPDADYAVVGTAYYNVELG